MSLLDIWERRKTLLFVVASGLLCATAGAESGLNVAVVGGILTDTGALFGVLVDLVIACIPLLLVLACVGMILALFMVISQRLRK